MKRVIALIMSAVLILADQLIKQWVLTSLVQAVRIPVIENFFYLTYVENRGAAFGIFQGQAVLLAVMTSVILLAGIYIMLSGKIESVFMTYCLGIIVAGGVGNFIDRAFRGFVVDYLDFTALFGFPVFNLADCCVVIGTILLIIAMLKGGYFEEKNNQQLPPEKAEE